MLFIGNGETQAPPVEIHAISKKRIEAKWDALLSDVMLLNLKSRNVYLRPDV